MATEEANKEKARIYRLENGLKWLAQYAAMLHVTNPDMQYLDEIYNLCMDVLEERVALPDFDRSIQTASEKAKGLAKRLSALADEGGETND